MRFILHVAAASAAAAALIACPGPEEPAKAPGPPPSPPNQPASQPSAAASQPSGAASRPADHPSTSTAPLELGELFAVPDVPGGVVARVGHTDVTRADLEYALRRMQLGIEAAGPPSGLTREEVLKSAVDDVIDREVRIQLAKERGVGISEAAVMAWVKEIEDRMEREAPYRAFIQRAGNTREHRMSDARVAIATQGLADEILKSLITRTQTAARAYYEMHKNDFLEREGREVWRIHVKAPAGMAQKDRDLSKLRAEDVLGKVKKEPKRFEMLAREYSEGGKAESGGALGFVSRGSFVPALEKQIFDAKPGTILPLWEDATGFYIYKVGGKRAERQKKFEEVEVEIFDRTQRPKVQKELTAAIEEYKKSKVKRLLSL